MNYKMYRMLNFFISAMALHNIVSLNCNGLCDDRKINCILSLCNERSYDIVCLQETFWNNGLAEKILKTKLYGMVKYFIVIVEPIDRVSQF